MNEVSNVDFTSNNFPLSLYRLPYLNSRMEEGITLDEFMTLKDFNISRADCNVNELKKTNNVGDFIYAGVELLKELAQYVSIISCIMRVTDKGEPRGLTRNEAILVGLLIRCTKLLSGYLNATCDNRMEISNVLLRSIVETMVNLKYLLTFSSNQLFDDFVLYSLKTESKEYKRIEDNIKRRGTELPIERRMKKSILNSIEESGVTFDQIDDPRKRSWPTQVKERFEKLELAHMYLPLFGIQSHFTHGNWQELLLYHLDYHDGQFFPQPEWNSPAPQQILGVGVIVGKTTEQFLDTFVPNSADKNMLNICLVDCVNRIIQLDRVHEIFLQTKQLD